MWAKHVLPRWISLILFINEVAVVFKSKEQKLIALSSSEAEFVASALALKQLRGYLNMVYELKLDMEMLIVVYYV